MWLWVAFFFFFSRGLTESSNSIFYTDSNEYMYIAAVTAAAAAAAKETQSIFLYHVFDFAAAATKRRIPMKGRNPLVRRANMHLH